MVGETLGSYKILSQLGAGGMGQVYLAEHRHLRRKAAVKVLSRELTDRPDLLERFFLEARATSAIEHPGIVQIFDCELDPTGRPYIVMEYLAGETLAASMRRRGPLPPAVAAKIARGIAEPLAAAHEKGIVHRDLKPDNIFVQPQPPDSVKLVDFGIAKLAGDFHAGQVHQTRSGVFMGTPAYMSPEQCRDAARTDFRTDLYSLGCVFFEMLTGHPPFQETGLGELIVAHMNMPPPDLRALNPAAPAAVADLVAELLRKDPATRPASMRAVADRLAAYLGQVTTVPEETRAPVATRILPATGAAASPDTTFARTASELVSPADDEVPKQRRPLLWALGAAAVAVVGGGLVWKQMNAPKPPAPAPAPVVAAASTTVAAEPAPSPIPLPAVRGEGKGEGPAPAAAATEKRKHGERKPRASVAAPAANAEAPSESPAATTAPPTFEGLWEGPWSDASKGQKGVFRLNVTREGSVAGWMQNSVANQNFRMAGRLTPAGLLELACECPAAETFAARGSLHGAGGELRGDLSLSTGSGVFGRSHVVLKRSDAKK